MIWIEKELPRASLLGMWMGVRTTLIWSEPNFYTPEPVRTFSPAASVTRPSGRLRNIFRNGQVNRAHPGAVGIADHNAELGSVAQYENATDIGDPALQALPVGRVVEIRMEGAIDIFVTRWVRSSIAIFDPLVAVIPATIAAIHGTIRDNRSPSIRYPNAPRPLAP
jgi:hypothetical protein